MTTLNMETVCMAKWDGFSSMLVVGFVKPAIINGYYFMNYLTRVLKINKILLVIAGKPRIFFIP